MTTTLTEVTHQNDWLLTTCPTTMERVTGYVRRGVSLPTMEAVWWHCPACEGWHVIILEEVVVSPKVDHR